MIFGLFKKQPQPIAAPPDASAKATWYNGFPMVAWHEYHGTPRHKSSWVKGQESRIAVDRHPFIARAYIDDDGRTLVIQRGEHAPNRPDFGFAELTDQVRFDAASVVGSEVASSADYELTQKDRTEFQRDKLLYAEHWMVVLRLADGSTFPLVKSAEERHGVESVHWKVRQAFIDGRPQSGWKRFQIDEEPHVIRAACGPFAQMPPRDIVKRVGSFEAAVWKPFPKVELPVVRWVECARNGAFQAYFVCSVWQDLRAEDSRWVLRRMNWNIARPPSEETVTELYVEDVAGFKIGPAGKQDRKYTSMHAKGPTERVLLVPTKDPPNILADSDHGPMDASGLARCLSTTFGKPVLR